jgi:membrane associated rhomboid family serine protease
VQPRPGPAHLLHWPAVARPSILAGLPKFQRGGFWLFVVAAAASAVIADQPLAAALTVNFRFLTELALWQPLSAIFVFPEGQLGGLIGTLLIQWFVGSHLEAIWGLRRYLTLVLSAAALGYLALALLGLAVPAALAFPSGGTAPADLAAVVGFGVIFGRQQVQLFGALPISARGLAALVAALMILSPLLRGHWPQAIPAAVAALGALLLASRWRSPPTSGKVAARGGARRPRHLKVVDAGRRDKLLN